MGRLDPRGLPAIEPTILDRAITWVSPQAGLDRLRARTVLALAGGYTAGRRDRRTTRTWRPGGGSANADLLPDLPDLRSRSRDLERNDLVGRGALRRVRTAVVGSGLEVRPQIDRETLGLSDVEVDRWERQAAREMALAAGTLDITGVQHWLDLQGMTFASVLASGDALVIRRWVEGQGVYATRVQIVEGDRVSNPHHQADTPTLAGGVETDALGRVVAYHVRTTHPGDTGTIGAEWQRIPAWDRHGQRLAFLLYDRERPDQARGEPYLAPVVEAIKQLGRFAEAEVMAAVISAMFTVFVSSEDGGGLVADPGNDAQGGVELGNGAIVQLPDGSKVDFASPNRPNNEFSAFVEAVLRQIGMALELPYEVLVQHFTASYSASRAALEMAWQFFRRRRAWLARALCAPVYDWVIAEAVARERLAAPGFFDDSMIRAAYLRADWIGPARPSLDPVKDAMAADKWIGLGVKTRSEVTAEVTGGDWESKVAERRRERALDPGALARPAAVDVGTVQPDPTEDEDEDGDDGDDNTGP